MRHMTWETIAPLVQTARSDANTAYVTFACPVSDFSVDTAAPLVTATDGTASRGWLARLLARALGRRTQRGGTDTLPEAGIIAAFRDVAGHFAWDTTTQRYVAAMVFAETRSALQELLQSASFDTTDERLALARVLADVAVADGHLDATEQAFFETVFGRVPGQTLEDVLALGAPDAATLSDLRPELRLPLLALAATMSLSDEIQDPGETARLEAIATALGLDASACTRALEIAREHILDEATMAALVDQQFGDDERAVIAGIAQRLGASVDMCPSLERRCRRRLGLPPA